MVVQWVQSWAAEMADQMAALLAKMWVVQKERWRVGG
jgi:hypothetical protein